jgi:hypothetical protein
MLKACASFAVYRGTKQYKNTLSESNKPEETYQYLSNPSKAA